MNPKLRVGVHAASTHLRAWQCTLLERIENSPYAAIAALIVDKAAVDATTIEPHAHSRTQIGRVAARVLDRLYLRLERGIVCEHDAFATRDAERFFGHLPLLRMSAETADDASSVFASSLREIQALELDVVLDFGVNGRAKALCSSARYGVWSVDDLDYPVHDGAPPAFWEVCRGEPVTRMALVALGPDRRKRVLCAASTGTHLLSVKLSRSKTYWNALSLVDRKLRRLAEERGQSTAELAEPVHTQKPSRAQPSVASLAIYAARNVLRRGRERWRRSFKVEQWMLFFRLGEELCTTLRDFRPIVPPLDRYWADPHVVERHGRYYVFIEEVMFSTGKGHISVIPIEKDGRYGAATKVLERPYHLSYPFVFEHAGELYMVPESMENRTIELYRCVRFPNEWTFVRNLMEGVRAVDSTLLQHGGKWWLFATVLENEGGSASEELFVFYTDCVLTGTWTSHASNPAVFDVTTARPAGAIQRVGGKLLRPAQDCSVRYGYAIRIKEIAAISPEEYSERDAGEILPDWDPRILAAHTLAFAPGLTVVDALLLRSKLGQHRLTHSGSGSR